MNQMLNRRFIWTCFGRQSARCPSALSGR